MAKRILIIEDDLFVRDIYQETLTAEGYDITIAENGEVGLKQLEQGGFDLILLDVMMPKMNGLEVLQHISQEKSEKPNGPVVLLTNLAHDPIIDQALKSGAKAFLIKSDLTPETLVEHVKKYL